MSWTLLLSFNVNYKKMKDLSSITYNVITIAIIVSGFRIINVFLYKHGIISEKKRQMILCSFKFVYLDYWTIFIGSTFQNKTSDRMGIPTGCYNFKLFLIFVLKTWKFLYRTVGILGLISRHCLLITRKKRLPTQLRVIKKAFCYSVT